MLTDNAQQAPEEARPTRGVWLLETPGGDRFIGFNVWIVYWLCKGIGRLLLKSRRIEIEQNDLVRGSRYIVASNHQSIADTFMICGQFPFRVWRHMGTLRYFTARGLFVPGLRTVLLALGCFPARKMTRYPSGLEYGLKQLHMGRTVMIFPEGRRTRPGVLPARHGVEVLAHSHPHAMVIPTHIEWEQTLLGRRFRVGIGAPFDAHDMSAQDILDRIYATPVDKDKKVAVADKFGV